METSPATPTSEPTAENTAPTLEFDPSLSEDERRFYTKAYPTVDLVRERKVHCTVCKCHIGTAPASESNIKMHPILRVTHCVKCHDFYNSGEFSKGEDGSELYCRWCGQGGEVYCCSNCPYVFCKSCIVKNLSRGVVADIEQNENWSCFSCAPKILWPLRAQHWALSNYIDKQKKSIEATNLNESDLKQQMSIDRSTCCRLAKSKLGNMSDSMESLDSIASKRSHASGGSTKKHKLSGAVQSPAPKRPKNSNDVVVCTPDLMSMLEPDCQITVSNKPRVYPSPATSSPKVMSLQPGFGGQQSSTPKSSVPPPLVLRSTNVQMRPITPSPVVRRTIIGSRTPTPGGSTTPVYHTINGYRIDLNTAAQQETFRLPNGKLIQVKRQGTPNSTASTASSWQQQQQQQHRAMTATRPVQITHATPQTHYQAVTIQQAAAQAGHSMSAQQHPQMMRYANNVVGNTTVTPITQNGAQIQLINGTPTAPVQATTMSSATLRPLMVRHVFPDTAIGQARTQLQDQVFNAMEICQHLTGKVQTLTNSNAYKQARNYLEVKELYIHLSYLLTYAIGRFKGLQDKCLADMRQLGFVNDATCLENGQLAADKQASDDEDNEIEIVEPKTDTITLDSDDEEASKEPKRTQKKELTEVATALMSMENANNNTPKRSESEELEFMTATQSFLASMLEVDLSESEQASPGGSNDSTQRKQPRKKTTHKPNPTLLKQKELLERERLEEMKRNDKKLKMKCAIELKKAEEEYPFAKELLDEKETENKSTVVVDANQTKCDIVKKNTAKISCEKDSENKELNIEKVELLLVEDVKNSTEAQERSEKQDANKQATHETECRTQKIEAKEIVSINSSQEIINEKIRGEEEVNDNKELINIESKAHSETDKKEILVKEDNENNIEMDMEKRTADIKEDKVNKSALMKTDDVEMKDVEKAEQVGQYVKRPDQNITMKNSTSCKTENLIDTTAMKTKTSECLEEIGTDVKEDANKMNVNKKPAVVEKVDSEILINGEPELDVDKEIEKLLKNSERLKAGDGDNNDGDASQEQTPAKATVTENIESTKAKQKDVIISQPDTKTTIVAAAAAASTSESSPDLFTDINELIEKESNVIT